MRLHAPLLAILTACAAAAPLLAAGPEFTIVSFDPASGPLAPVPGGDAATPHAFAPGNMVRAVVSCNLAANSLPYARAITVHMQTVPATAPAGKHLPKIVQAPAKCDVPDAAHVGPRSVAVAFGFSCPAHALAETQIRAISITLNANQFFPSVPQTAYAHGPFVVKCPQALIPHLPVATPTPAGKP